jgi:hypothetical protein
MSISDYITTVGIIVGVIGILVGIIGWKSLSTANQINNQASNISGSTIQQAQTITVNNGLDTYAIIKLSKETTQQELIDVVTRINEAESELSSIKHHVEKMPRIYVGKDEPKEPKKGDLWLPTED